MGSRHRVQEIGLAYHIIIKAVAGVRAFPDSYHRSRYLEFFAEEIVKSDWRCLGYTVLGTHVHLVVELRDLTLSSGFQRLHSTYAKWFNRRHARAGALWQARYYDVMIESDFQFLETQRYVALNAVRAGLAERPEDWPYCHYGAVVGSFAPDPLVDEDAILRLLGRNRRQARLRFQEYVDEPDPRRRRQMFLRGASDRAQTPAARARRAKRA